jgi:sugar O-acyltransferase (sialic acid O-acetyltransferase NeuD family)
VLPKNNNTIWSKVALDQVVVWGASGHALVVADILRLTGRFDVVGYLDSINQDRCGEPFGGAVVLGGQEQLAELKDGGAEYVALGVGDCKARLEIADRIIDAGLKLATAIHPSAIIADDARVGEGSVVCAGAVVNPRANLGRAVIVNTSASVDHDCTIADGVHLSPGVHLAGRVSVGEGTAIGIGSVARDGISIGKGCIIGAGAVMVRDLPDNVLAYGVPAKVIRENR